MVFDKGQFLNRFVDEAREHCATLNQGLMSLESSPQDLDAVHMIFRAAHSIKGSARMMKILPVSVVAHKMEDLLDALKQQKLGFYQGLSDVLFLGIDAIGVLLDRVAAGEEVLEVPADVCEALEKALVINSSEKQAPAVSPGATMQEEQLSDNNPAIGTELTEVPIIDRNTASNAKTDTRPVKGETVRVESEKLDRLIKLMGEIVSGQTRFKHHLELLREGERQAQELVGDLTAGSATGYDRALQLHALLRQAVKTLKESLTLQELLAGELQDVSLRMRMVPLSTTFDPLRRSVRDIAHQLNKQVDFVIEGAETQLDKKIVEKIGDPLMHMIRNAIDHGIEDPHERLAQGKSACGLVTLAAYREGGNVVLQLEDDGRGICLERVRARAQKKKLFADEALDAMSDAELTNLIFEPGFSTSEIITDISGRGVGMDVVKRNFVEELKGSITIQSHKDQGSTFYIKLPQTLAIFPLLFLSVAEKTIAIPSDAVCEIVSAQPTDIIDVVNKRALRLRNQIIPVEELATVLGLTPRVRANDEPVFVAIVQSGKERFGVLFDEVNAEEDLVVKPLPGHMKRAELVSGVVIGGNNEIINVLNLNGLYHQVKQSRGQTVTQSQQNREVTQLQLLVVDDSLNTREIERSILEAYGYQVTTAEDGLTALELTQEKKFDLIVTDVEMPRMDGFTLTEKLRQDPDYQSIPIIIVTSLEKDEDRRRGILAGADAYIVKGSFDQANLLDTVRDLIG